VEQVQYPNCGGYKVTGYNINEKLDPPLKEEKQMRPLLLAFLWISVVGSIFFLYSYKSKSPRDNYNTGCLLDTSADSRPCQDDVHR
jgi:hypothetical protein